MSLYRSGGGLSEKKVNTETGNIMDGNTRHYELQRRKLNVDVLYEEYTADKRMFLDLKEPPKKN